MSDRVTITLTVDEAEGVAKAVELWTWRMVDWKVKARWWAVAERIRTAKPTSSPTARVRYDDGEWREEVGPA